ncbi:MAG: 4-hydroxy-tetrahydrodipicolinate reductase [Clostridiales bacterium]|nr:4-hydroxy-tetrahydrodipicolinate reductase [Clostridiales bacterium]
MSTSESLRPTRVFLNGCCGHMGRVIADICSSLNNITIVAGADASPQEASFTVYESADDCLDSAGNCREIFDVIIDFSHVSALTSVLRLSEMTGKPLVMCTTGFSDEENARIRSLSKTNAVFLSGNMSLGINVLIDLAKNAARILYPDFDIEIIEQHHRRKIDAPSGTALMIADEINRSQGDVFEYEYDRHSVRKPRDTNTIGIHSIRGGNIVGGHSVLLAGPEENITISHSANTRNVFARGAVKAALFIANKDPGLYSMKDLLA